MLYALVASDPTIQACRQNASLIKADFLVALYITVEARLDILACEKAFSQQYPLFCIRHFCSLLSLSSLPRCSTLPFLRAKSRFVPPNQHPSQKFGILMLEGVAGQKRDRIDT